MLVNSVPLAGWRDAFCDWLEHCYDAPERYLETPPDPWAAGTPKRTRPEEIRAHNGALGKKRYRRCADRRAWTWEARFASDVTYSALLCVHIASDAIEDAIDAFGAAVEFETLPPGVAATARTLYEHSGPLLMKLTA